MADIPMPWKPLEERNSLELIKTPLTPEENERYSDEDLYEQFVRVGEEQGFYFWLPQIRGEVPMGQPLFYE